MIYKVPLHSENISAYILNEDLLIYSKSTQNVYGLEKGEASLFLRIDELLKTKTFEELSNILPGVEYRTLKEMVDLCESKEESENLKYETDISIGHYLKDNKARTWYQTDSISFGIHYPNKTFQNQFHAIFKNLYTPKPKTDKKVSIDFKQNGDLWSFHWNDQPLEKFVPESKLLTYVQKKIIVMTYQAKEYLIALHAAAVEYEGSVVVLPATSESGKTTLTAQLLKNGFKLFSDDVIPIDDFGFVSPLPFCMNIKEGSWDILSQHYPELLTQNTYKRYDGQNVKLLPPKDLHTTSSKVNFIIFPRFHPGVETSFETLTVKEALLNIKNAGYQIQNEMNEKKFEHILTSLIALPSYKLEYSNTEEAIKIISQLLMENKKND